MRRHARVGGLIALTVALVLGLAPATAQAQPDGGVQGEAAAADDAEYYAETDPRALSEFHDTLAPHGQWVDDPQYGTVWVPNVVVVGKDFAPYRTGGRWAVTDGGDWVWISNYDWGYIPFHYGRWVWIPARGWSWIPGRRYAPAWVVWRTGEPGWDYVGWAPMGPSYIWVNGVAVAYVGVGVLPFWFVPSYWMFSPYWHHHVVWGSRVHACARHTHIHHGHGHSRSGHRRARPSHRPAQPSSPTSGGHQSASPTAGSTAGGSLGGGGVPHGVAGEYVIGAQPSSPTYEEARIPKGARPKGHAKVDPRAKSLAKAPKGSGWRSSSSAARGVRGSSAARSARTPTGRRAPTNRATRPGSLWRGRSRVSQPRWSPQTRRRPSSTARTPAGQWRPPPNAAYRRPKPPAGYNPPQHRTRPPASHGRTAPRAGSRYARPGPSRSGSSYRATPRYRPSGAAASSGKKKKSSKRSKSSKSSRRSRSKGHRSFRSRSRSRRR